MSLEKLSGGDLMSRKIVVYCIQCCSWEMKLDEFAPGEGAKKRLASRSEEACDF